MTNLYSSSYDLICMLKPECPKITIPRVITLPHFPLHLSTYRYNLTDDVNEVVQLMYATPDKYKV